jgi:hypothetical protein
MFISDPDQIWIRPKVSDPYGSSSGSATLAATVRHLLTNAKVDNLLFSRELVRDLCTPIIMERMANEN